MAFNRKKSLDKAQKLRQKGKNQDAIAEYQVVVENDPADVRTMLTVGDLYAKIGNIEGACDAYHKVGEHYAKEGFFLKAVAVFKQILKLDPGLIRIYMRLAELYQQLGLNSEAMKQYQVVVRHYENQGLKKESLDVLRKMSELDPENTASRVKLAELYAKEGHSEASIEQFKAICADLKKKSNFQDLARVYEKMDVLGVLEAQVRVELCEIYIKLAEPKKSLQKLQELFKSDPKNSQVLELLARTFTELQQPEKAKSVYMELVHVFSEQGMSAERDRITAKLKAMGVSVSSQVQVSPAQEVSDEVELDLVEEDSSAPPAAPSASASKPAPKAASAAASSPAASQHAKALGEVETFMKYGLVDKACQILAGIAATDPANSEVRKKLISVFQEAKDMDGLARALERSQAAAEKMKDAKTAAAIRSELSTLKPASKVAQTDEELLEAIPESADVKVAPEAGQAMELEIVEDEPAASESIEADFAAEFEREAGSQDLPLALDDSVPDMVPESSGAKARPSEPSEPVMEFESPAIEISLDPEVQEPEPVAEPAAELADPEPEISVSPELSLSNDEPMVEESPVIVEEVAQLREVEAVEDEVADEISEEGIDSDWSNELEEAEFFVGQGLLEEAIEVYETILAASPDFEPARKKLDEIRGAKGVPAMRPDGKADRRQTQRASKKEVVAPQLEEDAEEVESVEKKSTERIRKEQTQSDEALFDLSNELQEEIQELEGKLAGRKSEDEEDYLSPEEVISEFKKGVARTVAKDDYPTHYNLGIAYKEMGLLDEAISEFEIAAKSAATAKDAASMIGLCLVSKRDFQAAIDVYRKALAKTSPTSEEALGLSYELAEAYIGHGNLVEAYKLFARIRDVDPTFRDVKRRAKELEADLGDSAPPVSAPEKPASKKDSVVQIQGKKNKISYI